jgi:hypothetical protein
VFEHPVDKEDREEIAEYQPGRPPRRTPKIEQFISEENQNEEGYRKPLVAQSSGPIVSRSKETSRQLAWKHKRAGQAEEIAGEEQNKYEGASEVDPAHGGGEIFRSQRWPEKTMQNHQNTNDQ